jgi:hypothetical protein
MIELSVQHINNIEKFESAGLRFEFSRTLQIMRFLDQVEAISSKILRKPSFT